MLCEHSHIKCESLAEIRSIIAEIKNFFLRGCFLLAHRVEQWAAAADERRLSRMIRSSGVKQIIAHE